MGAGLANRSEVSGGRSGPARSGTAKPLSDTVWHGTSLELMGQGLANLQATAALTLQTKTKIRVWTRTRGVQRHGRFRTFTTLHLNFWLSQRSKISRRRAPGRPSREFGLYLTVLGRGTGPRGENMAGRFMGTDSQHLATILDPFRAIFVNLGPDRLSAT